MHTLQPTDEIDPTLWQTSLRALTFPSLRNHSTDTKSSRILYPRNLRGVYDGTWKASGRGIAPFEVVPLTSEGKNGTENKSNKNPPVMKDWAFTAKSGFALLTAESHNSHLGEDINLVLGELLLRDGLYRSTRDVSMRVMGVYEWKSGRMVVVGDVMHETPSSALPRLYTTFMKSHNSSEQKHLQKNNLTQETFTAALLPMFEKRRKRLHAQRANGQKTSGVDSQCPFTATLAIDPSQYKNEPPAGELYPRSSAMPPPGRRDSRDSIIISRSLAVRAETGSLNPRNVLSKRPDTLGIQDVPVHMSGSFSSAICKTELTLELSTLDTDALFGKAINYTLLVTFVAFTQVLVLIRQMEMTSTQAGASRVSLMTVGLQAVADSYLCLGHLTMGIAVQTLFNAFATAAFFKFIIFSIFEMRYMLLIWKARRPSGFSEGWDAMRRELSMLYSRFYGSLLFGIFLLYQLQNHWRFFIFALYSFWVPQIVFSAYEDHRRPLHLVYIVGMSVTRLAIPLYFWSCPRNFLHIKPQPMAAVALSAWVFFQSIVLLSQYRFGARWFVPKALLPEKYDYFREIDMSDYDVEAEPLMRRVEEDEKGNKVIEVDCVICMGSVKLRDSNRMATPCNHCFHSQCLQNWLDIKMECPTCRRPLPPP